jgi:hypothetical protein
LGAPGASFLRLGILIFLWNREGRTVHRKCLPEKGLDFLVTVVVNIDMKEYAKTHQSPLPSDFLCLAPHPSTLSIASFPRKVSIFAALTSQTKVAINHRHSNRLANRQWDS